MGGVWVYTEVVTRESARIFGRKSANGETAPYLCYMGTACAAIATFKPELIEELAYVAGQYPISRSWFRTRATCSHSTSILSAR